MLKHNKSLEKALRYLYETERWKDREVAEHYGFTIHQCRWLRRRFGISTYIGRQRKLTPRHLTQEVLKKEYLENFLCESEVAKKYDLSLGQVHRLRHRYGIRTVEYWERHNIDSLTPRELEIIHGKLLGDGCLHVVKKYKRSDAAFYLEHSQKQREYIFWCYGELARLFKATPRQQRKFSKKAQKYYHSYAVTSIRHPLLTSLHKEWYNSGRKRVVDYIEQLLTPLTLAVWYMDDGHCTGRASFATCSFTESENELLKAALKSRYDIEVQVAKRKYLGLELNRKQTKRLFLIIKSYILPSMFYKIESSETIRGTLDE